MEYVLYNFNLNLGDTFFNPFGGGIITDTLIVYEVDSVWTANGYLRQIRLNFVRWIEGIGSFNYLLEPGMSYPVSGNDHLECMMSDTGGVYPGGPCLLCPPTGIEEINYLNNISIFPNPFQTSATLHTRKEFSNSVLMIFNTLGRKVKRQIIYGATAVINREGLAAGFYFFRVINEKGQTVCGKIVAE